MRCVFSKSKNAKSRRRINWKRRLEFAILGKGCFSLQNNSFENKTEEGKPCEYDLVLSALMNIADLRREYAKASLSKKDLASNPIAQFRLWLDQARQAKILEPNAGTLATVDSEGKPWTRTVLIKGFGKEGFLFFTNYESRKAKHIAANANVSLLFPWLALERQVILHGCAAKILQKESLQYFHSRPKGSQIGAWASPQSQAIPSREFLASQWNEIKRKFAGKEIPLPPFWGGYRVVPQTIEFWQGGKNRIHDRFLYTRQTAGRWQIQRLAP